MTPQPEAQPSLVERVADAIERGWLASDTLPPILFSENEIASLARAAISALQPALDQVEAMREALKDRASDCQLAADSLGNSGPEFGSVKRAFLLIKERIDAALAAMDGQRKGEGGHDAE